MSAANERSIPTCTQAAVGDIGRATAVVARLAEEGWRVQYAKEGIILRRGGAAVLITDDGEVISSDPIARLYVHCAYYPEIYAPAPSSTSH